MSDLVDRLRSFDCITMNGCGDDLRKEAAARIAELEAALQEAALSELAALGQAAEAHDAATKLRAKLREIITDATSHERALTIAREALSYRQP